MQCSTEAPARHAALREQQLEQFIGKLADGPASSDHRSPLVRSRGSDSTPAAGRAVLAPILSTLNSRVERARCY